MVDTDLLNSDHFKSDLKCFMAAKVRFRGYILS